MHTLCKDLLFLHGHISQPSVLDPPAPERALATQLPRALAPWDPADTIDTTAVPDATWRECA